MYLYEYKECCVKSNSNKTFFLTTNLQGSNNVLDFIFNPAQNCDIVS